MVMKVKGNSIDGGMGQPKIVGEKCVRSLGIPGLMFHTGPYTAFQAPPQKQVVHTKDKKTGKVETFEIQLPWIVYVASVYNGILSNIYIYAAEYRVGSIMRDLLYRLPLSNIYHDYRFCMPPGAVHAPEDLNGLYNKINEIVWDSYYNADLFSDLEEYIWDFPFMSNYPKDLPDDRLVRQAYERMLSPSDVFQVWEENITEENIIELFYAGLTARPQVLKQDIPIFSANNIVKANTLQYMG